MKKSENCELACVFRPKVHQICQKPIHFECHCQNENPDSNKFVACLKCLMSRCDYSGNFACPNIFCTKKLRQNSIINDNNKKEKRNTHTNLTLQKTILIGDNRREEKYSDKSDT